MPTWSTRITDLQHHAITHPISTPEDLADKAYMPLPGGWALALSINR